MHIMDKTKWNVGELDAELKLKNPVPFDNPTDAIEYSALMNRTEGKLFIVCAPEGVISFEEDGK